MDSGQGNGYDTLDFDDHAAVTRALHLQEDTFLACKVTADDTYFSSFRKIQFFGLEVQEMVVVSTGNGYETLHLHVGDDDFLAAAGVGDILQVCYLGLDTLQIGRAGMDKYQIMDNRSKDTDFLSTLEGDFVLHGNETVQMFLLEQANGVQLTAVGGTHGIP